jgi:cell division protein ZipA
MTWNPDIGIPIAVIGLLIVLAVILLSRPRKPDQGRREVKVKRTGQRAEPTLGEIINDGASEAPGGDAPQPEDSGAPWSDDQDALDDAQRPLGERPEAGFDRIVMLYVAARAGRSLRGPDLVVAAEKAGLVFGHRDVFHRLADGKPDQPPIFSVANLIQPGSFDMARIAELETPAISLFMTLPGPLPALDAWETMLPTAQRLAELLDAVILDEERNALGRQRIAHLRDELRAYDRKREGQRARW